MLFHECILIIQQPIFFFFRLSTNLSDVKGEEISVILEYIEKSASYFHRPAHSTTADSNRFILDNLSLPLVTKGMSKLR